MEFHEPVRPTDPIEAPSSTRGSSAFWLGMRAMLPLTVGIVPFGVVFGASIEGSGMGLGPGLSSSLIILAGASQLTMSELIREGSSWVVVISAALFINSRFCLYSAALSPSFAEFPRRWRFGLPLLLTDQAASVSLIYYETERRQEYRRWFFFGTGMGLVIFWCLGTIVGAATGASIPPEWQLDFAVPLMFLALLIPNLKDSPSVLAGVVGGAGAVLAADLPTGLNIIVGAVAGIVCGAIADQYRRSRI